MEKANAQDHRVNTGLGRRRFAGPLTSEFMTYRGDPSIRDGLGQLSACEAMLMGRTIY
jgi:hypothetical protein